MNRLGLFLKRLRNGQGRHPLASFDPENISKWSDDLRKENSELRSGTKDLDDKYRDIPLRSARKKGKL